MARSTSAEPTKPSSSSSSSNSKRKGTRSVSTLTPSQLARKRANDREAQRAIRARTKEHIERLERELEDLRSSHGHDKTVQELLRRNKALEDELRQLKESMGVTPMNSSPYSASTAYNEDNCGGAIPSPKMSPLPSNGAAAAAAAAAAADYMSDYSPTTHQYVPMPNCEAWASTLPSSVPSPSSSINTDEYGPGSGYIPTSVPSSMMGAAGMGLLVESKEVKMEFEGMPDMMAAAAQGYMPPQTQQPRPQGWGMYPGMYYDSAQNAVIGR